MSTMDKYTPEERSLYNKTYFENNKATINEKRRKSRAKYMRKYRLFRKLKKALLKKHE